jgi:hypothetical protein
VTAHPSLRERTANSSRPSFMRSSRSAIFGACLIVRRASAYGRTVSRVAMSTTSGATRLAKSA